MHQRGQRDGLLEAKINKKLTSVMPWPTVTGKVAALALMTPPGGTCVLVLLGEVEEPVRIGWEQVHAIKIGIGHAKLGDQVRILSLLFF